MLAELLEDFPSFCSLLEIKVKSGGLIRFSPDKWHSEQKKFHRRRKKRDIAIKPRQIGFTTLELARDLHHAVTRPGENVLVVVHDAALKEQLFLVLRKMADCLLRKGLLPRTQYSNKTELVFADLQSAVRIVESGATEASAKKKGRSGTIHRLHATEMAFWGAAAETWGALDAAVPDTGEVVIESTANGAGGLFYEMVQSARAERGRYRLHFFAWYDHGRYRLPPPHDFDPTPRDKWEQKLRDAGCDDQQITWWRTKVDSPEWGLDRTLQEFPVDIDSCFRVAGRQYFAPEVIEALFERTFAAIEKRQLLWTDPQTKQKRSLGELLIFEQPVPGAEYIGGGDVSEGTGSDGHAATFIEKRTARTVAVFSSDHIEPGDFGLAMALAGWIYNTARLAPERNNHGHAALRAIVVEAKYPRGRIFATTDGKLGWSTDSATRPVMVDDLGAAVRLGTVSTPDHETASECKTLVRNDKGKVEARGKGQKDGSKDDRWISWCIAFAVRAQPAQEIKRGHLPGY